MLLKNKSFIIFFKAFLLLKKKCKTENGFSSKELIAVLFTITLLCGLSVPFFYYLQNNHKEKQVYEVIHSLNDTLAEYKKEHSSYPHILDLDPNDHSCTNCFSLILKEGLDNADWYKVSDNVYLFSINKNSETASEISKKYDMKIVYDSETGKFNAVELTD